MFKVIIKDFEGQMHIIDGYFSTKREAEEFLIENEGRYADYTIVSRRKFESHMGIRRPFQLQYIKRAPKDPKYQPPVVHKRKRK